ncbi:hypothetical protein CFK37_17825 [Virgibacillus phasianinus]|uniref:Ribosomal protein L7/L12 C-terminal domain-containing protein n=1 Tax=Virgibacillus phasianinus TaxID=2017483 RepID=A0A220U6E7_9BACI|nr:hypothetical protein [Virgibacillus phasianinus]ASK63884.1 hypothetical protein CFK37_17825 [Virgibacillus phasianinus]
MESTFLSITFLVVIYLLIKVISLEGRIKGMKYTLNQLANQSEISEGPIDDELHKLLREGKDVKAVKRVREAKGLSLVEGKKYIDELKLTGR